jgi:hypothetical protein
MPGGFPLHDNPYSAQDLDPRLGGSTTASGPESSTTGTGYNAIGQSGLTGNTTTGTSDHHLGRDAAAVGTAGAVGEGIHHRETERDNLGASNYGNQQTDFSDNSGVGNTSSNTTTGPHRSDLLNKLDPSVDSNNSRTVDNTGSGHHYGRDAAAVSGAAAVGEGIHHHRENERENLGSLGYSGTTPSGAGSAYYGGPTGTAVCDVSGPHTTSTANRLDPTVNQNARPIESAREHNPVTGGGGYAADEAHSGGRNKHHLGRDAVVGAGGAGVAENEHQKHERERESRLGTTTGAYGDNTPYDSTTGSSGHHYGRDTAVGAGGVGLAEHEYRKHERERETGLGSSTGIGSNTGAYGDNTPYDNTTGISGHHYGRDAAVGAGGVGLAEHEHRKHEHEGEAGLGSTAASTSGTGPAPNTVGPHSKDWMNKLDPRVKSNPDTTATGTTGYPTHGERDAVAGAGLTGAAGYETGRHHGVGQGPYDETLPDFHHSARDASAIGAATGLDEHEKARLRAARGGPGNEYDQGAYGPGYDSTTTATNRDHNKDHHLGRDAAGAGVVGGGLYEAEKHHKHDEDLTAAEREEKEAKREHKEEKKHSGLLGFLRKIEILQILRSGC